MTLRSVRTRLIVLAVVAVATVLGVSANAWMQSRYALVQANKRSLIAVIESAKQESARSDDVARRLVVASMAYRSALREGQLIDSLLHCDRRMREVQSRLALLEQSCRKIGAGPPERLDVAQLRLGFDA